MTDAVTPRNFRMAHRRTRWWGRRRWDCQIIDTGEWLGWNYRSREAAVDHVRDLRMFEDAARRMNTREGL